MRIRQQWKIRYETIFQKDKLFAETFKQDLTFQRVNC